MSRFGLDIALDTLGIIRGIIEACNISTYSSGDPVPFVDDGGGSFVPATGATRLREDLIFRTLGATIDLRDGVTRVFKARVKIYSDDMPAGFDAFFDFGNSVIGSTVVQVVWNAGTISAFWTNDAGVSIGNTGTIAFSSDVFHEIELTVSDTFFSLKLDNTTTATSVTAQSGTATVDEGFIGGRDIAFRNIPVDYEWFYYEMAGALANEVSTIDLIARLWGETDPNGNKFTGSAGDVWDLNDASPFGAVYPHELNGVPVKWPTDFLVDDRYQIGSSCVTVEAGKTLVVKDGEYVTSNGSFVIK